MVHIAQTPDYRDLLDSEVWSFIDRTNEYFPETTQPLSIEEQRFYYNKMCSGFKTSLYANVARTEAVYSSLKIPCREYTTPSTNDSQPIVLYYHGGGFVVGNLDSHDDVCAEIAAKTNLKVIACDYRLAPEHTHPAAFDDAYALFQTISENTSQAILLVGDSAGATLAAAVSSRARTNPQQPVGQVLIYPYLGGPTHRGSAVEHAHAPMLSTSDMEYYHKMRLGPEQRTINDDDSFAPLFAKDFSGLPTTAIFSADCDPLRDDGPLYAECVRAHGGIAHCTIETGLVHGYLRARHSSSVARDSFDRILSAIIEIAEQTD